MRPNTVKAIIWINWIRFVIMLFMVFIVFFVIYQIPGESFITGLATPILNKIGALNLSGDNYYIAGVVIGLFLIPICFVLLEILFLVKRKNIALWIILALDLIYSIGNEGLPYLLIVVIVLSLVKSTRDYLKKPKNIEQQSL